MAKPARRVEPKKTRTRTSPLARQLAEARAELEVARAALDEAREQQTSTSEILKTMTRSTVDLEAVLATIIENAGRLSGAEHGAVHRFDGEFLHLGATYRGTAEYHELARGRRVRADRGSASGRAAIERRTIHIPDVLLDPEYRMSERQRVSGYRTFLAAPMLRDQTVIGVINLWKTKVEPFTKQQIDMLETFADQAVIAVENVRLFQELKAGTLALRRSVDELTALAQISQTVSSTLELGTVLTSIVAHAVALSASDAGAIYEYDEGAEEFHLRATHAMSAELTAVLRAAPPRLGEGALGQAGALREAVQVPDLLAEGRVEGRITELLVKSGFRALLSVPMIREDRIIGGLIVRRRMPGEFSPGTIDLLKTFAAQSALAIQNARLFREIADKGRELETASGHKSQFLANMSHELRTPLNAIIGYTELLLEDARPPDDVDSLEKVLRASRHLLNLITDILDLAKIEAGRMDLDFAEFDLAAPIDGAVTLMRESASRQEITLEHDVTPHVHVVRADERKVRQVLLNLLSNAVKFTPARGRIEVRARAVDGMVEIAIADTGVGIAPADREAVFDEFRQVGQPGAKTEGTGLGLALCRKFIELHGGRIWVESEPGVGSTFTFTLPVGRA